MDQDTTKQLKREFRKISINNNSHKGFILTSRRRMYQMNTVCGMLTLKVLSEKGLKLGGETGYVSKRISDSSHHHRKEGCRVSSYLLIYLEILGE